MTLLWMNLRLRWNFLMIHFFRNSLTLENGQEGKLVEVHEVIIKISINGCCNGHHGVTLDYIGIHVYLQDEGRVRREARMEPLTGISITNNFEVIFIFTQNLIIFYCKINCSFKVFPDSSASIHRHDGESENTSQPTKTQPN